MNLDLGLIVHRHKLKTSQTGPIPTVFDPVRKKHVNLSPEEFVRQLLIIYLTDVKGIGLKKILVEREITVGKRKKRFDVVILDEQNEPSILIECKSHKEEVNNKVFEQVANYNLSVNAKFLVVTNGMNTLAAEIDFTKKKFNFLNDFPTIGSTSR